MQYIRNYDFSAGTTIIADQIDQELNSLAAVVNGNIGNDNLAASAVTVDKMVTSINPETRFQEMQSEGVYSGLTLSPTSGWSNRTADVVAGTSYIRGKRVETSSQIAHSFTASKDTYIDLDKNGNFAYIELANGTAEPAVTANSLRIMVVITNATQITAWYDRRPWQWINVGQAGGPAFQNSWINLDTVPPVTWENAAFMKDTAGVVRLRGIVKSGTISATLPMFVLPKGFRPKLNSGLRFATVSNNLFGCASVRNDTTYLGYVLPEVGNNVYFFLDGITFKAEG